MQVQIGRFGSDIPVEGIETARRSGSGLSYAGWAKCATLEDLAALRAQLYGLTANVDEPVVPVIVEGTRSTLWRVAGVSWDEGPGAYDGLFTADWSVDLDSIAARDAALMEARLLLASTVSGGQTCSPWTAIPAQASGWTPLPAMSGVTVVDRVAESGVVRVFQHDSLADARAQWRQRAEDAYAGAASILAGDTGVSSPSGPSLPGATTYTTPGTYSYVVPTGVDTVRVRAVGGKGGSSIYGETGGRGAQVACDLAVTAGETLQVNVGGNGYNGKALVSLTPHPGYFALGGGGGANGGGEGGSIETTTSGYWAGGGGGGGASDVRQGGTDAADRVIVAGGGGGGTYVRGGNASTINGMAGQWGDFAGKGGTSTAPGSGGAGGFSVYAEGSPGDTTFHGGTATLGNGGDGGPTDPTLVGANVSGGGGGGGGYHGGGGGGCVGSPDSSPIKASSGGAGSSLTTGVNATVNSTTEAPQVLIAPIVTAGVGQPIDSINYRAIVNRQILADPFGWMVSNGIVRVRPTYSATEIGLCVQTWTGEGWGVAHNFGIFRWVASTYTSANSVATSVTVLRNAPEAIAIRLGYADANNVDQHTLDITLRRGAWAAEIAFSTSSTDPWAVRHDTGEAGTLYGTSGSYNAGIAATTADADGNKWSLAAYAKLTTKYDTTNGGVQLATTYPATFGVGVALAADTLADLAARHFAAGGETVRVIAS